MAPNDKERSEPASPRGRDENRESAAHKPLQDPPEESVPDLDGDGMIGNTGGFYGGTSYVGSNYGEDWNLKDDKGEGNYGAAGFKDRKEDEAEEADTDTQAGIGEDDEAH